MRVEDILPAGSWDTTQEIDRVQIDYDRRFRRRIVLITVMGREVLIDQPQAVRLQDGDGLKVALGIVRVCARPEDLMEICARPEDLIRIAWHLGNRHLPVQLLENRIRIRTDHVIGEMVRHLRGQVENIQAPFDPEAGAYAGGSHHHQDDEDDHHIGVGLADDL